MPAEFLPPHLSLAGIACECSVSIAGIVYEDGDATFSSSLVLYTLGAYRGEI